MAYIRKNEPLRPFPEKADSRQKEISAVSADGVSFTGDLSEGTLYFSDYRDGITPDEIAAEVLTVSPGRRLGVTDSAPDAVRVNIPPAEPPAGPEPEAAAGSAPPPGGEGNRPSFSNKRGACRARLF